MGFKLQKEAKAYETEFLSKAHASCDMLFSSLVELYMEDCRPRLKPMTFANKQFLIGTHVLSCFGNTPINKISPTKIRQWKTTLISHPAGYSQTYLKTVHNQVSAIFNFACKYYGLTENPARLCGSMGKKNADCSRFGRWMNSKGLMKLSAIRLFPPPFLICFFGLECALEKCLR